jgi:hypothetical protein
VVPAYPRLKYREIVKIVHGVDPTFDLTIPVLIHIEDPTGVSVDPTFDESF